MNGRAFNGNDDIPNLKSRRFRRPFLGDVGQTRPDLDILGAKTGKCRVLRLLTDLFGFQNHVNDVGVRLVEIETETGRKHQIRVHMMSVGHSVIGDRLYRSRKVQHKNLPSEAPDPGRQCLHALRIGLRHPRTHEEVEFEAPLAEDLARLLDWLRGRAGTG